MAVATWGERDGGTGSSARVRVRLLLRPLHHDLGFREIESVGDLVECRSTGYRWGVQHPAQGRLRDAALLCNRRNAAMLVDDLAKLCLLSHHSLGNVLKLIVLDVGLLQR